MARIKKVHGEAFKAKVALESVRGELTANQIGSRYGVHPTLVNRWRKELIAGAGNIFSPSQGHSWRQEGGRPRQAGRRIVRADRQAEDGTGVA